MAAATVSALMLSRDSVGVRRQWAHNRHEPIVEQLRKHRGIHRINVADISIVGPAPPHPRPASEAGGGRG